MASPTGSQGTAPTLPQGSTSGSAVRSHDRCFITDLSTELICQIIGFIPYESQPDFARTCKRLADCSGPILKRHQEAYKKYRVASDVSPGTIPTLLRSVFGRADPILAWHVRSIEIWYDRTSWLDWKPLHFDRPLHEEATDADCTSWSWQDDELEEYLEDIEDQFVAMLTQGDDEEIYTEAREHFENGLDGILKALLIAYCPRLRDVKFITHEHKGKSTLGWLRRLIQGSILHNSHWPPGLCSIQNVAVGVESDTWMTTRHTDGNHGWGLDATDKSMKIFSTLLRLPRLTSIYYNDLRRSSWDDATDFESRALIPAHSSMVKHIFLDDCGNMPDSFHHALPRAPRALETFTLRAGHCGDRMDDADTLVRGLCEAQNNSLHTLMFYGPYNGHQIHGYRCSVYLPEELNDSRYNLETVAIDISDVEQDASSIVPDEDDSSESTGEQAPTQFIKWFRETAFPESTQRLVFWGHADECYLTGCRGKLLDWLEDALINVIESWRWKDGWDSADEEEFDKLSSAYQSFLPDLKAIYLEEIERQYKRSQVDGTKEPEMDKVYFTRLVEVAKEAGIDVYTLTNRAEAKHSHEFPTAPDKYDLRSGPWWERRHETKDWVFDVYKGRRVPPGCGKCGKCEHCLGEYTKELWESLNE